MEIPGYKIECELGRGGMATVYLATQESLSRSVALKVVSPVLASDESFTARFLKEGRIIAQLNHPNIITIFDCGAHQNYYYLCMEYLPGGTLEQQIGLGLSLERALEIIKAIGNALGYAHSKGIIHRDVKPLNILFRMDGTPVLTDFGIAKSVAGSTQLTAPGIALGSLRYMSPEQVRGQQVDARADLYSLGVLFYKMLTGRLPYEAEDPMAVAIMHSTAPLPVLSPELATFQPVLEKLLAKEPDDRYATAEQFVKALTAVHHGQVPAQEVDNKTRTFDIASKHRPEPTGQRTLTQPISLLPKTKIGVIVSGAVAVIALAGGVVALKPSLLWPDSGKERVEDIGAYYLQQAEQRRQAGALQDGLAEIEKGLRAVPNHAGLLALREKLQAELAEAQRRQAEQERQRAAEEQRKQAEQERQRQAEQERQKAEQERQRQAEQERQKAEQERQKAEQERQRAEAEQRQQDIERLLGQAEQQRQRTQLDNASTAYQQVLKLDPSNAKALAGLGQIATYYQQQAEQRRQAGALQDGLAEIEKGLRAVPNHAGLLALREKLQAELAEAQRRQAEQERQRAEAEQRKQAEQERQRKAEQERQKAEQERQRAEAERRQQDIERLLGQAEQQRQRTQLDNASTAYQQVLKLDPSNAKALAGLGQIATYYQQQAEQRRQAGALQDGLAEIEKGLRAVPNHAGLLALREKLQAELAEAQRRQAEQERQRAEAEQRKQAEQERQRKAEQERQKAEQERQRAEEERRKQAEKERQRKAEQERQKAEQERRRESEQERQKAEQERRKQAEQERRRAEEERRRQAELERRKAEQEQRKAEQERRRQAEQERQKAEEERRRQAELERQRQAELERRRQVEQERRRQAELERQKREQQERQKKPPEEDRPRVFGTF